MHLVPVQEHEIERTLTMKVQRDAMIQRYKKGAWRNLVTEAAGCRGIDLIPIATDHGKIDRDVLPEQSSYVAPSTPVEVTLATIWSEVLGLEQVGANDNLFALGGDSIAAMRVLWRVNDEFHVRIPLRSIFYAPTLADLASTIAQKQ
jgi:acyl carrier protein